MNPSLLRWSATAAVIALGAILLSGCVVEGGGYGYEGAGIAPDYYEPYGYVYGGWAPGYHVGPYRGGEHHPAPGGGHPAPHYRPAPSSHAIPSIPSRSGGTRSR